MLPLGGVCDLKLWCIIVLSKHCIKTSQLLVNNICVSSFATEFDDLELCTSLTYRDGGSQWWGGSSSLNSGKTEHDVTYLQQLVEDLRGQLSQSQALIRSLQPQTCVRTPVSTPRKVNWGLGNSEAQSTAEEDEGWQSSDGFGSLPRHSKEDRELQELVSRVTSLEEQLRKGKGHSEEGKAVNWPG